MIKNIRNFFRILRKILQLDKIRKILKLDKKLNLKKIIPEITEEEIKLMDEEILEERETDFAQQSQDQEKQITLQAQAAELTNKLMPQPDQQIDAGAEQEQPQQQQPAARNNNPYNIQQ
jgi:hypothetical protein